MNILSKLGRILIQFQTLSKWENVKVKFAKTVFKSYYDTPMYVRRPYAYYIILGYFKNMKSILFTYLLAMLGLMLTTLYVNFSHTNHLYSFILFLFIMRPHLLFYFIYYVLRVCIIYISYKMSRIIINSVLSKWVYEE